MDDFDLIDATIDPTDVASIKKRNDLLLEIEYEQILIKSKMLFKIAFKEHNPLQADKWMFDFKTVFF